MGKNDTPVRESNLVRLHVNLSKPTNETLQSAASRRGMTVTETVRKAIGTWAWLDKQIEQGSRLQIVDRDGTVREVVLDFAS
jgi:hypothetical protein